MMEFDFVQETSKILPQHCIFSPPRENFLFNNKDNFNVPELSLEPYLQLLHIDFEVPTDRLF